MFDLQRSTGSDNLSVAPVGTSRRGFLKYAGIGALAVGSAGALAACGGNDTAATAAKPGSLALTKSTRFRIASAPGDNYFIDAVSASEKLYGKYNLEVGEFLYPQSGVQGAQLLSAGAAEGMMLDITLTMANFVSASPGKRPAIVGLAVPETTYAIVTNKGTWPDATASFEEKLEALRGKKVGVAAVGAGADQQLRLALQAAGMEYEDVTHVAVGQFASGVAQMKANRVDAYVAVTYATSRLMAASTGGNVYLEFNSESVPEVLSKQQVQVFITREDNAEKNEAAVKAWLAAEWDAKDWIVANQADAAALLNQGSFAGGAEALATEYVEHYANDVVPKLNPMWKVSRDTIEHMAGVATELGMIKSGQVSYEDIVPEFARA